MSVQMNQYLAFGYYLDYKKSDKVLREKYSEDERDEIFDKYHDSAFKTEITEINGCSLISDGMNGKYNFFGKIFDKSTVYEPLDTQFMPKVTKKIKENLKKELIGIFGTDFDIVPEVIILTHYR
jgi:hypothetical protein